MGLYWQKSFIGQFQSVYFKNKSLYAANKMVPCLDNMDQRIADDTRNFTSDLFDSVFGSGGLLPVSTFVLVAGCCCSCHWSTGSPSARNRAGGVGREVCGCLVPFHQLFCWPMRIWG